MVPLLPGPSVWPALTFVLTFISPSSSLIQAKKSRRIAHWARKKFFWGRPVQNLPPNPDMISGKSHLKVMDMDKTCRNLLLLLVIVSMLLSTSVVAQGPARPAIPVDIAGEWRLENSEEDTTAQPPLGDYLGIPFNAAGRMRSDTTAESIWGTPEYQCRPHSAPHQWRGLGGARILKEQDPLTREVRAYHVQFMRSLDW